MKKSFTSAFVLFLWTTCFCLTSQIDASILITPASGTSGVTMWSGTVPNNPKADDIELITGFAGDLFELYKADVDNPPMESGAFAGSYETTFFNDPLDPADAVVEYVGGAVMNARFALVKDGNQVPSWYIFDLQAADVDMDPAAPDLPWNGTDDLNFEDFWPNQGAISHIAFFGPDNFVIPEPATIVVWSMMGLSVAFFSRRTRRS